MKNLNTFKLFIENFQESFICKSKIQKDCSKICYFRSCRTKRIQFFSLNEKVFCCCILKVPIFSTFLHHLNYSRVPVILNYFPKILYLLAERVPDSGSSSSWWSYWNQFRPEGVSLQHWRIYFGDLLFYSNCYSLYDW